MTQFARVGHQVTAKWPPHSKGMAGVRHGGITSKPSLDWNRAARCQPGVLDTSVDCVRGAVGWESPSNQRCPDLLWPIVQREAAEGVTFESLQWLLRPRLTIDASAGFESESLLC